MCYQYTQNQKSSFSISYGNISHFSFWQNAIQNKEMLIETCLLFGKHIWRTLLVKIKVCWKVFWKYMNILGKSILNIHVSNIYQHFIQVFFLRKLMNQSIFYSSSYACHLFQLPFSKDNWTGTTETYAAYSFSEN